MVRRDNLVALVHHNSNGSSELINGNAYVFIPQYGISLAWVLDDDVPVLLEKTVKGCCGVVRKKYAYATENQVKVYETGGY